MNILHQIALALSLLSLTLVVCIGLHNYHSEETKG